MEEDIRILGKIIRLSKSFKMLIIFTTGSIYQTGSRTLALKNKWSFSSRERRITTSHKSFGHLWQPFCCSVEGLWDNVPAAALSHHLWRTRQQEEMSCFVLKRLAPYTEGSRWICPGVRGSRCPSYSTASPGGCNIRPSSWDSWELALYLRELQTFLRVIFS